LHSLNVRILWVILRSFRAVGYIALNGKLIEE
jgi:hypothetical protein